LKFGPTAAQALSATTETAAARLRRELVDNGM
jgi:hypothetical protein